MSYQLIIKDVKKKQFLFVYFLYGVEIYFIDLVVDVIEEYVLVEYECVFN